MEDRVLSRLLRVDKREKRSKPPFRSWITTSLDVFVATEPKIEVFPRTLTVIRFDKVRQSSAFPFPSLVTQYPGELYNSGPRCEVSD